MKIKIFAKKSRRLTLKGWAAMNEIRTQIRDSSNEGEWKRVSDLIFKILNLCGVKISEKTFWLDVVKEYGMVLIENLPTKQFPILTSKDKSDPPPWEYEGRSWYFWFNLFAEKYGWGKERIESMDIDEAIGLYQEIVINDQLDDEFQWGMSETAYVYNKSTKKSHYQPLPRPDWMKPITGKPKPVKTRRIPVYAAPAGTIINLDEQPSNNVQ
jgi:hypothetical protein